jgi:hypothetical protein
MVRENSPTDPDGLRTCVIYNSKDGEVFYGQISVKRREANKVIEHLGWLEPGLAGTEALALINEKIGLIGGQQIKSNFSLRAAKTTPGG